MFSDWEYISPRSIETFSSRAPYQITYRTPPPGAGTTTLRFGEYHDAAFALSHLPRVYREIELSGNAVDASKAIARLEGLYHNVSDVPLPPEQSVAELHRMFSLDAGPT